ncbi:MAG: hypothetical protein ACR2GK_06625 [Gemmatimonadaceae bacterium]
MHHRLKLRLVSTAALAASAAIFGCVENPLDVNNQTNPDVARVYGSPKDVETIVSKLFQQMWNGQQGVTGNIGVQSMVMSLESHSALANFGFGARANIPRGVIDNSFGNSNQSENFQDFDVLTRNARSAANAIAAVDRFKAANNTIGSPARDARAKSFGFFVLGYALANTAFLYDSAAIITPRVPSDEVPPLSDAATVMAAAISMLDSALAITTTADATNGTAGWPIPADWVSGETVSLTRWQQIIRSYRARFRAGVARTPAQRAQVDWNAVVADAAAGITADFIVNANVSTGWQAGWRNQLAVDPTWSQMTPFILGMGDTSGGYQAWLATPIQQRTPFLLRTPDMRFPAGETRAAQQAVTGGGRGGTPAGTVLYFRNRPTGEDSPALPWGEWYYDNWRFWSIRAAGGNGPVVAFSVAEVNMLEAEGYMRTNRVAQAGPLIDKTRVRAGLPPVTGISNLTTPVPGGSNCVPQVPQPPSFTTTACGNIFEAMKWEKRLETAFTGYAQWFIDSRGWGDLVEGTSLEWAVPWQELYARLNQNLYVMNNRALKGTYGF